MTSLHPTLPPLLLVDRNNLDHTAAREVRRALGLPRVTGFVTPGLPFPWVYLSHVFYTFVLFLPFSRLLEFLAYV